MLENLPAKKANLLPFTLANLQAMAAVAVSANRLFEIREERFVLLGIDFVFGMTTHTKQIDFRPGIHNLRRCTVTA